MSRIFEDMEIKECASSRFKDDNKEQAKHVDAPCENKRHAGSTPATSTIYRSKNGASRPMELLLSDYCQKLPKIMPYFAAEKGGDRLRLT